jgi:hypothetical protein
MVFSRDAEASRDSERVLGFGHVVFHEAVRQSREFVATVTAVPAALLPGPIFVFRVSEHVTSSTTSVRSVIAAVAFEGSGKPNLLSDWELIDRLNGFFKRRSFRRDPPVPQLPEKDYFQALVAPALSLVSENLERLDISFVVPDVQLLAMICPSATEVPAEEPDPETN